MRKTSGISLMVLIFLSLCLITFSLLSLSGATADETLSKQAAARTSEYYAAVTEANRLLTRIDAQLASCLKTAEAAQSPEAAYFEACGSLPETIPEVELTDDDLTFTVPIAEGQILRVKLAIVYPAEETDTLYRIDAWETVNTEEWTADKSQNLYIPGKTDL